MSGVEGKKSPLSLAYMVTAIPICFVLLRQLAARALSLALLNAGNNIAARMAMMAMTTSSSINVNPSTDEILETALFVLILIVHSFRSSTFIEAGRLRTALLSIVLFLCLWV